MRDRKCGMCFCRHVLYLGKYCHFVILNLYLCYYYTSIISIVLTKGERVEVQFVQSLQWFHHFKLKIRGYVIKVKHFHCHKWFTFSVPKNERVGQILFMMQYDKFHDKANVFFEGGLANNRNCKFKIWMYFCWLVKWCYNVGMV